MKQVFSFRNLSQSVQEEVLAASKPDRYPFVVIHEGQVYAVYRPDPKQNPLRTAQVLLGALGEDYVTLPVPPWVGVESDDSWAHLTPVLMRREEAREMVQRFLRELEEVSRD